MEYACKNAVDRRKETIKKRTVFKKERAQFSGNGKDAMTVLDINDFKGHGSSPVNGVHVAAGRTEAGMASEGDELQVAAERTAIHGTTKGRITAVNHFFYIFDDRVTRMLKINHFFKMVREDSL